MDEEWDYSYTIDCIHRQSLVNQGIEYCDLNLLDLFLCDTCPMKQSKEVKCHMSATSIEGE